MFIKRLVAATMVAAVSVIGLSGPATAAPQGSKAAVKIQKGVNWDAPNKGVNWDAPQKGVDWD